MGYRLSKDGMTAVIKKLLENSIVFAPKNFYGGDRFSDTDCIRYGEIKSFDEIVFDKKSMYSFKEAILPLSQTLLYFTEDTMKEANPLRKNSAVIFLRSCDLHGLKRLDEIYLKNGFEDYYYRQLRSNIKFILIGCSESFENCFCVSMGSNKSENYDACINVCKEYYDIDNSCEEWEALFREASLDEKTVAPDFVVSNQVKVKIPKKLSTDVFSSSMWDEYDSRCINCGRCNFVCPTCTCFTMQDIYYTDNGKVGERRRVMASCMVDGFTDVAGGGSYRAKNGQRMRFKVMHKVYDFKKRNGYQMCVGCGRCDDVCPEYISFSHTINKLDNAMKEAGNDEK